jgi:hypothetical protein
MDKIEEAKQRNDVETLKRLNVLKYNEIKNILSNCELKDEIQTEDDIERTIFNANAFMKEYLTKKIEELL